MTNPTPAPDLWPVPKVAAGGIAALVTVGVIVVASWLGVELPDDVAELVAGALVGLAGFAAAYLKKG